MVFFLGPGVREDPLLKTAEASAALAALGYSQSEIGVALRGVDVENLPVEQIVKQALRAMISK